jgi:hypothetical protein
MKRFVTQLVLVGLFSAMPALASTRIDTLLDRVTVTGAGAVFTPVTALRTFQAYGATSAGSGSATIVIEVSNVKTPASDADWITAGTITLTLGVARVSDGFAMNATWRNVRAHVTALTGTTATVTVVMGTELPPP